MKKVRCSIAFSSSAKSIVKTLPNLNLNNKSCLQIRRNLQRCVSMLSRNLVRSHNSKECYYFTKEKIYYILVGENLAKLIDIRRFLASISMSRKQLFKYLQNVKILHPFSPNEKKTIKFLCNNSGITKRIIPCLNIRSFLTWTAFFKIPGRSNTWKVIQASHGFTGY